MTTIEPVPASADARAEAKAYLRVEHGDEDALIDRLIATAISHGERFTGQLWLARGVRETLAASRAWQRLSLTPVTAIASVGAIDPAGDETALAVDAYAVDIDPGGDGWVRTIGAESGRLRASYSAGLAAEWSALAEPLRQGAIRLAAHLYTHRDAADEGEPPAAVAALWRPWRRMRLA